jgi:hypothetical protein
MRRAHSQRDSFDGDARDLFPRTRRSTGCGAADDSFVSCVPLSSLSCVPLSRGTSDESYEELGGYAKRHKACWLRVIPVHRR